MIALVTGETDGIHKNKIFLGDQDLVLEDVKCQGKLVAKKRKRKDDKEEPEEKGLPCGPVNWLGVHHNYEWFASFEVSQPEKMWISQLESSKSITLQLDAISGLVHLDAPTYSAVNALNACVRNKDLYHRVRSEAALALARTVGESTNWTGINTLLNLYREIFFNPDTYSSLTTSKENALQIADQLVSHSASVAIGLLRDEDGLSPQEATDFLLELLKYAPHDGIAYSVNERITFLLKGIGVLAIDSKERLEACLKRIRTFLQRDQIFVSDGMSITCACLQSICSLLIEFYRRNPESDCGCMDEYLFLTKSYTSNHHSGTVRTVANICVVLLESIRHGCKRAFQSFLDMLEDETSSYVKMEVTEKVKESFVLYRRSMHEPLNTGDILDALELCLDKGSPIQLSYKLFEFVQLLGKRPLSLHRASEEALHREFFVKLQREHSHLQVPIELERRAPTQRPRPSKMTVDIPVVIEADEPPSPCLRSFTMESGHTFQVGQRVKGKWRNGPDWYGGSITKIHQSGTFDILYDDGDLETDVPIVRMIPEGGWQFTSASAQELVTDAKKSSKKSKIDLNQLGDADAKSLYAKLVSETSKEKPLTEEEKKQKLVEELMRLASKILNGLRSAKAAAYFMNPVSVASFGGETQEQKEKAFEEYLKVIEGNPMDLGTVTEKTRGAKYESPLQFRDDVRQIFINSRKFNVDHPESIVYKAGEKLSETFETKWKESHIEELWEAGEIRSLTRVESRAHTLHDSNRSQSFRGKVKFEDEQTQKMWGLCLQVLREVKTHPNAWPFLKPVDPEKDKAPDYFEVVKEPMDFNTVTDKLARRVYENVSEFKSDMELVFKNCRLYNKVEDNAVRKLGDDLEVFFKSSWDKHDIESKLLVENKVLTKEDEMMKECDRIVHFLKKHKYAEPFLKPVTQEMLQLPELWAKYQDVVKTPMDISTIASKQRRRKYSSIDEFKDDVNLVFENCFKFNFEGDPVHKAGKHLKRGFRKRWKKLEEKFGIERLKPDLEAWKRVEEVVSKIFNNDLAISFRAPVDKISVPDYYDVIKTPIDLGAIQSKVHNKEYASPVQVKEDMDLLFANCRQYNKEGDPLSTRGEELNKVFGELWSDAKIEALMAESACVSGEDSLAATLSEGGTLVPETTLLTNDSGQSQDTSKHHAEVLSKEKPLHGVSPPVKMEIDDVGAGGHETAEGVRGGGEGMEIDQAAAPDNSNGFPKIRLKSLPPKKVSLEIQGESDNPGSSQVHVVKEEAQLAAQGDAGFTPAQFQECLKLIFMLKKNKVAEAFVNPVTADTFGDPALWGKYQQIVTKPMDLTTIHNKLKSKEINAPKDLWEDVTQIFENCYRFNYAVDPVFVSAKELQRVFMKRWGGFERKFALEPQAASILEDIFSSAEVFLRSLVDHESYASLKTEVAAMDGIGFDFGPIARKLKTREYKEPTQVRDDLRFQFQALLREVEGNDLLHSKVEDFQKVFHGLWEEGEFEKKFSRCVLKSESPKKIHREARKSSERVAKAYPSQGDVKAEHAPSPPKEKPSAPTGGLTLKIKFGAPKQ
uniref:Bromo domain-containing protein n=1 Tax=Chloropicon primus TaxID=1764295 RepID=A0A7S2WZM5_9CHLO